MTTHMKWHFLLPISQLVTSKFSTFVLFCFYSASYINTEVVLVVSDPTFEGFSLASLLFLCSIWEGWEGLTSKYIWLGWRVANWE